MFFGTIHEDVRRYIAANRKAFEGARVVVGCSGNFTSEKVLVNACRPAEIHSNDVSLYSKVLAEAALGQRSRLEVIEEGYEWIQPYLDDKNLWTRPAVVMIMLRMLKYEKQNSYHARRMWTSYNEQFADLIDGTRLRLLERDTPITSYFNGDVFEHFLRHEADQEAIFTAYLPFFKGDYESQYKRLQQIISWDKPTYEMLDQDRKDKIIDWLRERRHLFLLDYELEGIKPQMVSHKGRNTWVYLYSNIVETTGLFRRKYGDTGKRFKLLEPGHKFTRETKVGLAKISSSDIQYYKGLFLARNIDYTAAEQGFAVLVDGAVAGFIEMSRGKVQYSFPVWYMLSDFPIEPNPHPRFSKLIVMIALTKEMKKILERTNYTKTEGVWTTARTEKPVSMKYRGPMKLLKRGVDDQGAQYLNYGADWTDQTIDEVYQTWWKRYVKR